MPLAGEAAWIKMGARHPDGTLRTERRAAQSTIRIAALLLIDKDFQIVR